jgi:phosphatidylglycerol:prolipoprotein diacylglycerol transferase
MLVFPEIDPIAFQLGPIVVRWYALAYLAGFIGGWRIAVRLAGRTPAHLQRAGTATDFDDFLAWGILGVIVGGRLGYILFYNFGYYIDHPLEILQTWRGGMSFHGGLIGMMMAFFLFCRNRNLDWRAFGDVIASVVPLGIFFGRIANFINGELYGRVTDGPLAMVFPGDPNPRHPSQLYQAATEGLLLFIIMMIAIHHPRLRGRPGLVGGLFLLLYGIFRAAMENFRSPDIQLGFIVGHITMGQILCIPMMVAGGWLIISALRQPLPESAIPAAPADTTDDDAEAERR